MNMLNHSQIMMTLYQSVPSDDHTNYKIINSLNKKKIYIDSMLVKSHITKKQYNRSTKYLDDMLSAYSNLIFRKFVSFNKNEFSQNGFFILNDLQYLTKSITTIETIQQLLKSTSIDHENTMDMALLKSIDKYLIVANDFKNIHNHLKEKAIKKSKSKEENLKTCGWCLEKYPMNKQTKNMITHHYKLVGVDTGQICEGEKYTCLENSLESLIAFIDKCDENIKNSEESLKKLYSETELMPYHNRLNSKTPPALVQKEYVTENTWQELIKTNKTRLEHSILYYMFMKATRNKILSQLNKNSI